VVIQSDDEALYCDICTANFHRECVGLPGEIFEKLTEIRDVVGWVCHGCRKEATVKFNKLQAAQSALAEEVCSLKVEVEKLKKTLNDQLNSTTAVGPLNYADALKLPVVRSEMQKEVRTIIKDADRRSRNVVVSGLKPVEGREDADLVRELFETELSFKPAFNNDSCKRVGKAPDGQPRRILITVRTAEEATDLLKEARKLRNSSNLQVASSVYLNKDLSPEEAKIAFELRAKRRAERQQTTARNVAAGAANVLTCIAASSSASGTATSGTTTNSTSGPSFPTTANTQHAPNAASSVH
jgi:hypothetical protein